MSWARTSANSPSRLGATNPEACLADNEALAGALARLFWVVPGRDYGETLIHHVRVVLAYFGLQNAHDQPVQRDRFAPDASPDEMLERALGALAWVVPGRDCAPAMIADARTVLAHFGKKNDHETSA